MEVEVETLPDKKYIFYPFPDRTVKFKLKALSNGYIMLSKDACPAKTDPVIEVLLGVKGNQKSIIRRDRAKPHKASVSTPGIVDSHEYLGYWLKYEGGIIQVGLENTADPFITWLDPDPIHYGYIGFCTPYGVEGYWIYNGEKFITRGILMHEFRPVHRYHLEVEVQAKHNAILALTTAPKSKKPIYEVAIGGWENTGAAIRYNKELPEKVFVEMPDMISPDQKTRFCVHFYRGLVRVTTKEGHRDLMKWPDPKPFDVTYFGLRSRTTTKWNVTIVDDNIQDYSQLDWVWAHENSNIVPDGGVLAGTEGGYEIYVGRHDHIQSYNKPLMTPGYWKIEGKFSYVWTDWDLEDYDDGDVRFEILIGVNFTWAPFKKDNIPPNAVVGGLSCKYFVLYIGRIKVDGNTKVGKIDSKDGVLYVNKREEEEVLKFRKNFEILLQN